MRSFIKYNLVVYILAFPCFGIGIPLIINARAQISNNWFSQK